MALSRTAWVAGGLAARLLTMAALAMSVRFMYANYTNLDYGYRDNYNKLHSYTYAVVAAAVGMAGGVLQIPVSVYLLCRSKRMVPSVLVLDVSMYADMAVCLVLASGVGAGFGATNDILQYMDHGVDWDRDTNGTRGDLTDYFHRATVAIVFLLVGMVLSVCAAVVSARLRARAGDDSADV